LMSRDRASPSRFGLGHRDRAGAGAPTEPIWRKLLM
jgi:hypothetical protein